MPILKDISEHKVPGREYRRGFAAGFAEAVCMGKLTLLRKQIRARFGEIPEWADENVARRSGSELEVLGVNCLPQRTFRNCSVQAFPRNTASRATE